MCGMASYERVVSLRKQGQYDEILGSENRKLHLYPVGFPRSLRILCSVLIRLGSHYHKNTVQALAWSPNGNMVASASRDQTVRVFDIRAMREVQTLRGHKKEVCCMYRILLSRRIKTQPSRSRSCDMAPIPPRSRLRRIRRVDSPLGPFFVTRPPFITHTILFLRRLNGIHINSLSTSPRNALTGSRLQRLGFSLPFARPPARFGLK